MWNAATLTRAPAAGEIGLQAALVAPGELGRVAAADGCGDVRLKPPLLKPRVAET